MELKKSKRLLLGLAAAYWLAAVLIYLIAGERFRFSPAMSDTLSPSNTLGEIVDGMEIHQRLIAPADSLDSVQLMFGTYGRANAGAMRFALQDEAGETVAQARLDVSTVATDNYVSVPFDAPAEVQKGDALTLVITSEGCESGSTVTLYSGTTVTTGRFDLVQDIADEDCYTVNGERGAGKLCVKLEGIQELAFYRIYFVIVALAFAAAAAVCLRWWRQAKRGENNPLVAVCTLFTRYGFLLRQLVSRDFKTKYKRSILGMFWSFLNPLLTMSVQYVVFSTLFRSDIANFPVYLLCGIVFFNFFSEAVSMGMTSIVGNASLIKKVYMPKYVYPVSRIISSLVNFSLALIPLLLVSLATGLPLRPSFLLLLFDIACLLGFVTGMALLLTTAMTFFQDTQFLWSVVSMMWTYLTPIFYPETIIPAKLLVFYHMNPMYQYITFARICIIDGASPAPTAYLWCIVSSAVVLLLGVITFKRQQDKFMLYL